MLTTRSNSIFNDMIGCSTSRTVNFTFQTDLQVLIFSLSKCRLFIQRLHTFPSRTNIDLSHEAIRPIAIIFFEDEADLLHGANSLVPISFSKAFKAMM